MDAVIDDLEQSGIDHNPFSVLIRQEIDTARALRFKALAKELTPTGLKRLARITGRHVQDVIDGTEV